MSVAIAHDREAPDARARFRSGIEPDAPALASICARCLPATPRWAIGGRPATRYWLSAIRSPAAEVTVVERGGAPCALMLLVTDEPAFAAERRQRRGPRSERLLAALAHPARVVRWLRNRAKVHQNTAQIAEPPTTASPLPSADRLWLELIAVDPSAAGHGIASTLLSQSETRAADLQRSGVQLRVEQHNTRAIKLYLRAGYKVVSADTHALVMVKTTGEDPAP